MDLLAFSQLVKERAEERRPFKAYVHQNGYGLLYLDYSTAKQERKFRKMVKSLTEIDHPHVVHFDGGNVWAVEGDESEWLCEAVTR